jgi:Transglycosylase SLT domain
VLPLPIRLKRAGIVYPNWTRRAASLEKLDLTFLCAILMEESAGGENVFGHDPTIFVGAGQVTRPKYQAYAAVRDRTGEEQGVGPCQLTSKSLQVEADQAGGCWDPEHNIAVGAHFLAGLVAEHGGNLQAAATAYNGSGPAAEAYGVRVMALREHCAATLDL